MPHLGLQARETDLLQQLASLQACIKPKYLSKARMRAAQHKAASQHAGSLQPSPSLQSASPRLPHSGGSLREASPQSPKASPGPKEGATLPAQSPSSSRSSRSCEATPPNGWTVQQPNGVYEGSQP